MQRAAAAHIRGDGLRQRRRGQVYGDDRRARLLGGAVLAGEAGALRASVLAPAPSFACWSWQRQGRESRSLVEAPHSGLARRCGPAHTLRPAPPALQFSVELGQAMESQVFAPLHQWISNHTDAVVSCRAGGAVRRRDATRGARWHAAGNWTAGDLRAGQRRTASRSDVRTLMRSAHLAAAACRPSRRRWRSCGARWTRGEPRFGALVWQ